MRKGKVTPRRAARILGVHYKTVINWCRSAVAGEGSRLSSVEVSVTGRYYLDADEVRELRHRAEDAESA